MTYAKGIDISTWQDASSTPIRIDFSKPKLYGIKLIINRAVFSTDKDEDFDYNWGKEKEEGYLRSAYGFWDYRPGNLSATAQARSLVSVLKNDPGEFPVVWMDFERPLGTWPEMPSRPTCLTAIETYMKTVEDGLGKECGLYTSSKHIKYNLAVFSGTTLVKPVPDWLKAKKLWIAGWPDWSNPDNTGKYKALPGETLEEWIYRTNWMPSIYKQWDKWTLWQYGTPAYGTKYGMESKEIDTDFFNGSEQELYDYCNTIEIPKPEGDEMLKMIVQVSVLNVRNKPSSTGTIIGKRIFGDIITVYNVAGINSSWVQIDPVEQMWCCVQNSNGTYLLKDRR